MKKLLIVLMALSLAGCFDSTDAMIDLMKVTKTACKGKLSIKMYVSVWQNAVEYGCDDLDTTKVDEPIKGKK
jgi:hypothetical protein